MSLDVNLFRNYWHMVCHRRELLEDKDFIKFQTPIGDVVIFNDRGNILAFDNKCAHRGALIYQGEFGNQANSCRYHGWTYRAGKLIIPELEKFINCRIEDARLNQYLIEWCGDFIFLGIDPKNSLYEQLGDVASIIESISFNVDSRRDFNRYKFECYWPIAVENALEPHHIKMIHPQTLAKLQLDDGKNIMDGLNSIWYSKIGNSKIKKQLTLIRRFFDIDYQYEGYMSVYMFPFTMISSTFGYSYSLQNFMPALNSDYYTNFTSRLLISNINPSVDNAVLNSFFTSNIEVNRKIFVEDHSICKLLPKDSWSMEPLRHFSSSEEKIQHFRRLCREQN